MQGVRQRDSISPTITRPLSRGSQLATRGCKIKHLEICCLLYADDIMIMSETEENVQAMLEFVHE